MAYQIKRGQQGWLEAKNLELQELMKQNPGYVKIMNEQELYSFRIIIRGKGKYENHKLEIRCRCPTPAQPPKFELLNESEIASLGHPHIKDVYICLKAAWSPSQPISTPIRAIMQAWWNPVK
jgi:ubiquitin-protein ligase